MVMELAKFIPSKMRLEIAQSVIEEKGIRPLAREVGVNPKSVYKYKRGTSHPGDEIMTKILAVAKKEESISLNKYMEELKGDFSRAIEAPIDAEGILAPEEEGKSVGQGRPTPTKEKPVDRGATVETPKKETVDEESTGEVKSEESVDEEPTEKVSVKEVCEKIGVDSSFNQTKVQKIISTLTESPQISMDELVDMTNLSEKAIEKYLEDLISNEFVEHTAEDEYRLKVNISEG